MMNIVVLGIGNRLLTDDGTGVHIVEELKKQDTSSGIVYIAGETDIDYCLDQIKDADYLIIIDAARLGKPPGHISVLTLNEAVNAKELGLTMHSLHLFDMLVLSNKIPGGIMIGIEPHTIDYYFGLSAELNPKLKAITERVRDIINHFLPESSYVGQNAPSPLFE